MKIYNINYRFLSMMIGLMFCFGFSFSQTGEYYEVRDLETWTSIGVKYKLNKKWKLELEEQIR